MATGLDVPSTGAVTHPPRASAPAPAPEHAPRSKPVPPVAVVLSTPNAASEPVGLHTEYPVCPLGLECERKPLLIFSQKEMAPLNASDAPELAQLLAVARRPANLALLSSLARGLIPHDELGAPTVPLLLPSAPITDEGDLEQVRHLLRTSSATRPRSVAALAQALSPPPPSDDFIADEAEARRLLSRCTRPRTRAIVQLTAARIAESAARGSMQAETHHSREADHTGQMVATSRALVGPAAPPCHPSLESSVLLVRGAQLSCRLSSFIF